MASTASYLSVMPSSSPGGAEHEPFARGCSTPKVAEYNAGSTLNTASTGAVEDVMEDLRRDLRQVVRQLHDEVQWKLDDYILQRMKTVSQDQLNCRSSCDREQTVLVSAGHRQTDVAPPSGDGRGVVDIRPSPETAKPRGRILEAWHSDPSSPSTLGPSQLPLLVPRAMLQTAILEDEAARGENAAVEATLSAGFLGGAGWPMQACWMAMALCFGAASFDNGAHPHAVSNCGEACTAMRVIHKTHMVFLTIFCCLRAYLLRARHYREAHKALMVVIWLFIEVTVTNTLIALHLQLQEGCAWRSDDYIFQELGSACGWVGVIECLYILAYEAVAASIAPAIWYMRGIEAERVLTWTIAMHALHDLFCCCFAAVLKLGVQRVFFFMSGSFASIFTIAMFLCRRMRMRQRAWTLVREDAVLYDGRWEAVCATHSDSIRLLARNAKEVAADIKDAAKVGPAKTLPTPENLRRSLLTCSAVKGVGVQQVLRSLPLLYAQAFALDPVFQQKCAQWAAGVGHHAPAAVKHPERAVQKLWRTYQGNPRSLCDLVRGSIICQSPKDVMILLNRILSDKAAKIVRIKNRFDMQYDSAVSGGYRNLSLNIIIVNPETHASCTERHICELQIGLSVIHDLKSDGGHGRFVAFRDLRVE
eukprot:TRINITY_DN16698_c0_g1_i1.p1 TRINITY_DN16698_c0_g1~~TRINITY_DN16698_c0_g1_i1.p1  ORF type:complete len:672 (+),score=51.14 TRINITY_DN16698_c0_g1_i1:81-2018(+)